MPSQFVGELEVDAMWTESQQGSDPRAAAVATFAEVDRRAELLARPRRAADHVDTERVLSGLADEMATNPSNMLQALAEAALELCIADTAGISLLDGDVFRWEGLAGAVADKRHGTMPREASPCGVCIDDDRTQLMCLADRRFPALRNDPRFVETLLVPFHAHGRAVGTIWVVAHTPDRQFDLEDERLLNLLGRFASAGWQLWTAYTTAELARRERDAFLAMLGHELRTPLGTLTLAVATGRLDPAKRDRAFELAGRQCVQLTRLVDDLLDVARVTQGKIALRRETVAIEDVIDQAVENCEALVAERAHTVSVSLAPEGLRVNGDRVRLVQIVTNLLVNAAKYTPPGGRIDVAVDGRDDETRLSVRDTGVGIAAGMLSQVFDLYAQASDPHRRGGGLGIGLTVAKQLVELHGGQIAAHSDGLGTGSTFVVTLPGLAVADRSWASPAWASPAPIPLRPAGSARVLVVDDDVDTAVTTATVLRLVGHEVRVAHDAATALVAAHATHPDVVVIDIGLPATDGYEVARRLRQVNGMERAVLVALTGHGGAANEQRAVAAGFHHHLLKPVDLDRLQGILVDAGSPGNRTAEPPAVRQYAQPG
jgi:signal transduction histidine kinase/ActR/RegA family two-component response regulator